MEDFSWHKHRRPVWRPRLTLDVLIVIGIVIAVPLLIVFLWWRW